MTLAATITGSLAGTFSKPNDFNDKPVEHKIPLTISTAFTDGTGAGEANQIWADERSLSDAGTENIDLAGTLIDDFGDTVTFTGIKAIVVQNQSADAGLEIGPASSNGFLGPWGDASDVTTIPAGSFFIITNPSAAGWAVTASTGDLITLTHDGTGDDDLSYKIAIIGIV